MSRRAIALLALLLPLAACLQQENAVQSGPDGSPLIVLRSGMNCYRAECLDISLRFGTVQRVRLQPVPFPPGIDPARGVLTPAEFAALSVVARAAPPEEIDIPDPAPF